MAAASGDYIERRVGAGRNVTMTQQPGINRMPMRDHPGSSRDKRTCIHIDTSVRRRPRNSFIRGVAQHTTQQDGHWSGVSGRPATIKPGQ